MEKYNTVIGMDVHARSVTLKACITETGEVKTTTLSNCPTPERIFEWIAMFPSPWHAAYESGCTDFALARELNELGCDCDVIAITTLKRSSKDKRRKNDKVDANVIMQEMLKPADDYSCVWIPGKEVEGVAVSRGFARMHRNRQDVRKGSCSPSF